MKTTIEVNGLEIVISEENGLISVSAMKDGEMMEEFEIQTDETEGEKESQSDDMTDFEEFGAQEEEDFDKSDDEESDDEESDDDDDEESEIESGKLESFQSFFKKKIKK